jgi:hypothetical protein
MIIKDAQLQIRNMKRVKIFLAILFLMAAVKGIAGEGNVFTAISLFFTFAGFAAASVRIEILRDQIGRAVKRQEILGRIRQYRDAQK